MQTAEHTYLAETPKQARAVVAGRSVRYVLMFGTLGAFGVFAMVYLLFFN
jgi:hypothetical protein